LIVAASSEAPNETRKAASTRSLVAIAQNCSHDSTVVRSTSAAIGISTIRLR
jgi:hypothetical protein